MTAITDAVLILETLAGKTLTNTQMINIVEKYIQGVQKDPEYRVDVTASTNEEKAQTFLDLLIYGIKAAVKRNAAELARAENDAVVAAAIDASVIDL